MFFEYKQIPNEFVNQHQENRWCWAESLVYSYAWTPGETWEFIREISSPKRSSFFLGIWANLMINKYMCGRFEEWYNTVFQLNSKSVGREAELRLSCQPEFYRSEALQQAEVLSIKIACQAELYDRV